MVKGHSYDRQLFYSVAHRLINNIFLNKTNGIVNGVGNSCSLTNTNNTITIKDGFFIVQGGINEVEDSQTIPVTLDNGYCRLVYEVDMSRVNTEIEFNQGRFKILTGANAYPTLTQQTLTESNGIYQYEFAQFRALTSGISSFTDKRTFIDYETIFQYIKEKISQIEDESIFFKKSNFVVLSGTKTITSISSYALLNYPAGFTKNNCVVVSAMMGGIDTTDINSLVSNRGYIIPDTFGNPAVNINPSVGLNDNNISVMFYQSSSSTREVSYKIVLMKVA